VILMLSNEAEVKDRIRALQVGADDYVGKPYDLRYVVARARELLAPGSAAAAKATVLVIDDSPTFREELREALAGAGYAVLLASSGEEGLRIAAANRPDAVFNRVGQQPDEGHESGAVRRAVAEARICSRTNALRRPCRRRAERCQRHSTR